MVTFNEARSLNKARSLRRVLRMGFGCVLTVVAALLGGAASFAIPVTTSQDGASAGTNSSIPATSIADQGSVFLIKEIEQNNLWEQKEQDIFDKKVKELEATAKKRAESFVPKSMDISLLGGGWAFLLEFSTVIVIIFTLLILGIAGVVSGKDITTILASVAGYVLGRATAGAGAGAGGKTDGQPATAAGQSPRGEEPLTARSSGQARGVG